MLEKPACINSFGLDRYYYYIFLKNCLWFLGREYVELER